MTGTQWRYAHGCMQYITSEPIPSSDLSLRPWTKYMARVDLNSNNCVELNTTHENEKAGHVMWILSLQVAKPRVKVLQRDQILHRLGEGWSNGDVCNPNHNYFQDDQNVNTPCWVLDTDQESSVSSTEGFSLMKCACAITFKLAKLLASCCRFDSEPPAPRPPQAA